MAAARNLAWSVPSPKPGNAAANLARPFGDHADALQVKPRLAIGSRISPNHPHDMVPLLIPIAAMIAR
jgi:hypothetical protein